MYKTITCLKELKKYYNEDRKLYETKDDLELTFVLLTDKVIRCNSIKGLNIYCGSLLCKGSIICDDLKCTYIEAHSLDCCDVCCESLVVDNVYCGDIQGDYIECSCLVAKDIECNSLSCDRLSCRIIDIHATQEC